MRLRFQAALVCGLLGACASPPPPAERVPADRVVVLPGSDGTVGAVVVRRGEEKTVLSEAYASARPAASAGLETGVADAEATRREFAAALQALPAAPASFVVYFVFGQDELTDESRKAIGPVLEDFARRPAAEMAVAGHADQVGTEQVNDALSLKRAERVRDLLVKLGVPAARISALGRGAREPLVRAAEGLAEPRNRRVEITVR